MPSSIVAWCMQVAAAAVVGSDAGAFVVTGCEAGGTAAVVGTLRADGVGLAAVLLAGTAVVAGAVVGEAVVGGAVVDGADALMLCEAPTWAWACARSAAELESAD